MVQISYYQLSWHLVLVLKMALSEILLLTSVMILLWRGQKVLTSLLQQHHYVQISLLETCLLSPSSTMTVSGGSTAWSELSPIHTMFYTKYQMLVQTCTLRKLNVLPQTVGTKAIFHWTKYYHIIQSKITRCMGHAIAVQSLHVSIRHPISSIYTWLLY